MHKVWQLQMASHFRVWDPPPIKVLIVIQPLKDLLEQRINQSRASDQCIRMQLVIQHQNQVQYNFFIHFSCMKLAIEKSRAFASELM